MGIRFKPDIIAGHEGRLYIMIKGKIGNQKMELEL